MADPAKTAKKRAALPPRIVQKTPRYPTPENQAQSTRKLLVRPSMMREARMTTTATATPLLGITPSLVGSSCSRPGDRVTRAGNGQKETRTARSAGLQPEGEPRAPPAQEAAAPRKRSDGAMRF